MRDLRCFLFGEAEKGPLCIPKVCKSVEELFVHFGQPPKESGGIFFAIQALYLGREVVYYRVKEEGYSFEDYFKGFMLLKEKQFGEEFAAIFLPGVGSRAILDEATPISNELKSFLVINHSDFYDYLTDFE